MCKVSYLSYRCNSYRTYERIRDNLDVAGDITLDADGGDILFQRWIHCVSYMLNTFVYPILDKDVKLKVMMVV